MVALKTYKMNLDYEVSLFDPDYVEDSPGNQKIIKEFEYVFFLANKENTILKNYKTYEISYLEKLIKMGFIIPKLIPGALTFDFWWGPNQHKELEQVLNSKLTSAKLARLNGWGFEEGTIIENLDELKSHLNQFPHREKWIIKHPNSFSGIGHTQFRADAFDEPSLLKILKGKVLLEPVYERVFDIGTTFEISDGIIKRQFMVENFNAQSGGFKGGAGSSDADKFKKYIFKKYSYSLEDLEKITYKIAKAYLELGASSNIQIDSFVYREEGKLKLYSLVEVNYRKTMGLVIQSLAEKYPTAAWIEWKIIPAKILKTNPLGSDWIELSPQGNYFQSFIKTYEY